MNSKKIFPGLYSRILLTGLAVFACVFARAQQAPLDSLQRKFDRYRTNRYPEKIYAHLDQSLYLTGETLWFKLYVVNGTTHTTSDLSKVAYLEVVDKDKQTFVQTKVALHNGTGNGSVFLPASLTSGNYVVRVYTRWMKNFAPEFYFHAPITIINTFRKLDVDKPTASAPEIQFFPEGGNLVKGIPAKVAFRVSDKAGKGIRFKGAVVNQLNDTVAHFEPLKFGIGNFVFTPQPDQDYRAVISDEQGRKHTTKLPAALDAGYTLLVKDSANDLLSIKVQQKGVASPFVYVFIHARNSVSSATVNFLQQGSTTVVVSKKDLQPGISHITVFDADLQPRCERLYFVQPDKKLTLAAEVSQAQFGVRRKVSIDITARNGQQHPAVANLSMAVYKLDSLQGPPQEGAYSYLWLSSDLKGAVESPEYYVEHHDAEALAAADNLMLTHGWRRFSWNEVLTPPAKAITFIPEYRGHIITGHIAAPDGGGARGITTYLSSPSKKIQLYTSVSSAVGEVHYEVEDFIGPKKIIAQANMAKDSARAGRITIDNPFSEKFAAYKFSPFTVSSSLQKSLLTRNMGMQVQDIFYQDKLNIISNAVKDSSAFYGKPDAQYFLDDYTRFTVMEEVMREYVPGVMVRKRKDGFHFMNINDVHKGVFSEDPIVLLDGVPVFDIDKIMEFDPLKVKKLEVFTRRYYVGTVSMTGLVSYTTYTGDMAGFVLDPRAMVMDYEGLQLQREFYSPTYENQKQHDSRWPDRRSVLFWAPQVITKDGKQHVEFYTSDVTGDYTIVIRGLTADGQSGSTAQSFSVKQFDH
ncbi:hypothetical protein [Chryseolinea lacunae]|uniref:Macroglobulin domain-containing protein n=1 Tax=Chryseolinea lacunae TaxID=2801331 RepID=A0ABS1L3M2_9BACT|nr:hypothetical protein [Chryseolinea lacunae]MBL0745161.1 hypothetical protein [Chryseolinea lacunae]